MICPSCRTRKAKRACPALGQSICPTCCATKRLKEIACPADCHYLASAQAHPAAIVQRQRERDLPVLLRLLEGLTDAQARLLGLLQQQLHGYRATAIPPLRDADVEDAARSLAATFETASRGIVYEHHPASLPAQRVLQLFQALCEELARQDRTLRPDAMAAVLRRLERAAHEAPRTLAAPAPAAGSGGEADAASTSAGPGTSRGVSETAFLDFLDRVSGGPARAAGPLVTATDGPRSAGPPASAPDDGPRLILP